MLKTFAFVVSTLIFLFSLAPGQPLPHGYLLPEETLSPGGRYGVLVPQAEQFAGDTKPKNKLIEVKTGQVLAELIGHAGRTGVNHESVLPSRWAHDDSLLLWQVDGKWAPITLVLIKIQDGQVTWQSDLYREVVKAILERTSKAEPEKYATMKNRKGYGANYPDGFTIDVYAEGGEGDPVSLPLKIHADLTSDPKGITSNPLTSRLDGTVDKEGKFTVSAFQLGAAEDLRRW